MPGFIEAEMVQVDNLPGIWSPVQWDLTPEERVEEVEIQARASLLEAVNVPEAILRMLLGETEIERIYEAPPGYDPEQQGEWDNQIITFQFKRPIKLMHVDRTMGQLRVQYDMHEIGKWLVEIKEYSFRIEKL